MTDTETTPLLCEGACNPQHTYVVAKAAEVRSTLIAGEPMSGPVLDLLHSLRHTPHKWARTDYGRGNAVDMFACVFCRTQRAYGRRDLMITTDRPFIH